MLQVNELVGKTIGEFQIERLLGQSQLGVAYRAQHLGQGHKATVTMFSLPADILPQEYEQLRMRFARDGEALVQLTHPHILPIYAYGIQQDYVYLITAFVREASLAQFLKQNVRFTPQQVLPILKQLADGLDHAHSKGIVHGMLSLSNMMINNDLTARIAGFGLRSILDIHGDTPNTPPSQLSQERSTFLLGNAEYIAPERLIGLPIDARTDIYALGIILFVLLSGTQPFKGAQPLDIAIQRLQRSVPSLHSICPEVSEAFDLVIGRALERDPARRLQSAGEIVTLFERVIKSQDAAWNAGKSRSGSLAPDQQMTLPPTINWFDEQVVPDGQWQTTPPLANEPSTTPAFSTRSNPNSVGGPDPFAWWATTSTGQSRSSLAPGTFPWNTPVRNANAAQKARRLPDQQGRRRLVSFLVIGAVAGSATIVSVSLAHLSQSTRQPSSQITNSSSNGNTGSTATMQPGSTSTAGTTQGTAQAKRTATPKSSTPQPTPTKGGAQKNPTAQPTVNPTAAQPTPTPTAPPTHTGTVIGATSMATNNSKTFTNPADGQSCLLIRLANGSFVACERACTHEGVPVNYNSGSQTIICPAHNAVFNPSSGFAHVSGPGNGPLPTVSIHVNADGTITTG